jgi:DMSO/TMAO reductase YedYZ molybdopterin-dependent catalytic subunit
VLQVALAGWGNFASMVTGFEPSTLRVKRRQNQSPSGFEVSSRRSFLTAGAAVLGTALGLELIRYPKDKPIPSALRSGHRFNEALWSRLYRPGKLAPTFSRNKSSMPRVTGKKGLSGTVLAETWQLTVLGPDGTALGTHSLDDIKALDKQEITVEHKCVEGWSHVVTWGGTRFSNLVELYRDRLSNELPKYVNIETAKVGIGIKPDDEYYVSLDIDSMMHEQTMLTYELQGNPLNQEHGAPLRLTTPLKYGIKQIKRIGTIEFSNTRGRDFWEERGYDWYSHL